MFDNDSEITFETAVRESVPLLVSLTGASGSGKTVSGLLLAKGLSRTGNPAVIETEKGRAAQHLKTPVIAEAFPNAFKIRQIEPPYSPLRFLEYLKAAERAGYDSVFIDSFTDEWEGDGGCHDIADTSEDDDHRRGWERAKDQHFELMRYLKSQRSMSVVLSLRAREKVKVVVNDQNERVTVPIGWQAVTEKDFNYDMDIRLILDEKKHTHKVLKCPDELLPIFGAHNMITAGMGEELRKWIESGEPVDAELYALKEKARNAARIGLGMLENFLSNEPKVNAEKLRPFHAEFLSIAAEADRIASAVAKEKSSATTQQTTLFG